METKRCIRCNQFKPLSDFYRNKDRIDGRLERCKACVKEYEQTPQAKARRKKFRDSLKGKLYIERNRPTKEEARNSTRKYRSTEHGKIITKTYYERSKAENPDRVKARTALMHAIQKGKIVKPNACQNCGNQSDKIHGHHWSYLYEHRLDVIWLCPACHKHLHQSTNISST